MCPPLDILQKIDQAIAWEGELSAPAEHAVAVLKEARAKIERMHADRLKLDERIHNQRRSCRETWEIVEMRRKWMRGPEARRFVAYLLERNRELQKRLDLHLSGHKRSDDEKRGTKLDTER